LLGAYVDKAGAVVIGPICVDGHRSKCLIRVVTHIHQDHTVGLERSSRECRYVVATPITHELLDELGFMIPRRKRVELGYGSTLQVLDAGVRIRLEYAHHIPGSAQVIVESDDGAYAYSGDFKGVGTKTVPPKGVDVLVVDATYGDPSFRRPPEEVIVDELVKLLRRLLSRKPVTLYAYYGKAQEIMLMLREYGVDAPIIASTKHWRIAKRLERFGLVVRDLLLEGTREANEVVRDGWFIKVDHFSKFRCRRNSMTAHVALTGWLFNAPIRCIDSDTYVVAFSDHADFDELVGYIEDAKPRLLVVDAVRGGATARKFAEYVREALGIDAVAYP